MMNFAKDRPEVIPVQGQDSVLYVQPKGGRTSGSAPAGSQRFPELEMLANWLDSIFHIPGSKIRFGLDALLGLIPGLGDTVTSAASIYILLAAAKNGVPRVTILRMASNIALDYIVGCIPFLGDVFDVFWKANVKNVALLQQHAQADPTARRRMQFQDWLFVGGLAFGLIALLVGCVTIAWWIVAWIMQLGRPSAG